MSSGEISSLLRARQGAVFTAGRATLGFNKIEQRLGRIDINRAFAIPPALVLTREQIVKAFTYESEDPSSRWIRFFSVAYIHDGQILFRKLDEQTFEVQLLFDHLTTPGTDERGHERSRGGWNLRPRNRFKPEAQSTLAIALDSTRPPFRSTKRPVRTCVIFNPSARGEKAKHFRRHLDGISGQSVLKLTTAAGEAQRLAAEAVREGFEVVVAAGGDGTVNEVLNGIVHAPGGLERTCLGVLPLGTVNVFARELGLPTQFEPAWELIRQGHETRIDLPSVKVSGHKESRYFAQLAGAGLDARAVELVKWQVKKVIGPLAYVLAGLHAVLGTPAQIRAEGGGHSETGELVLIGNGKLYGGPFNLFPNADLRDGLLEVCVVPHASFMTLARCGPGLLLRKGLPASVTRAFRAESLTLTSLSPAPVQIDGELIGHLPATFSIERARLRVIARA